MTEIVLTLENYSQFPDYSNPSENINVSLIYTGFTKLHVAKLGDPDVVRDGTNRVSIYDFASSGYNGQGIGSYYKFEKSPNDPADTIVFGNQSHHSSHYGRTLNAKNIRMLSGVFTLKDSRDGRSWIPGVTNDQGDAIGAANGPDVPVEAVFMGRHQIAGNFHLNLQRIQNSKTAVLWGSDSHYATRCHYGRSVISCDEPLDLNQNTAPKNFTANEFYKGKDSHYPFDEVQGKTIIRKGMTNATIRYPSNNVRDGYDALIEEGSTFTWIFENSITWSEARSPSWLSQISGDQIVVFESVSDFNGQKVSYNGIDKKWILHGSHKCSKLALESKSSFINKDFFLPDLQVTADGDAWIAQDSGLWRRADRGGMIVPTIMPETTSFLNRSPSFLNEEWKSVYDTLMFELKDMGLLDNAVMGYIFGGYDQAISKIPLFSSPSGKYYNLSSTGLVSWSKGSGFTPTTPSIVIEDVPSLNSVLTLKSDLRDITVAFIDGVGNARAGLVDRRNSLERITQDISESINDRNSNEFEYIDVHARSSSNTIYLSGNLIDVDLPEEFTINSWGRLSTDYNMSLESEGLSQDDMLMIVMTRSPSGYKSEGYNVFSGNGSVKLLVGNTSLQGSCGTQNEMYFPDGCLNVPSVKMIGSLGSVQFGIEKGRIVTQQARIGDLKVSDQIGFGGSDCIFMTLLLKASDLLECYSVTKNNVTEYKVRPINRNLSRLHGALMTTYRSVQTLL